MPGDLIHVRSVGLVVSPARDGVRRADGRLRDVRHQGYTYTGSLCIGPGVVHDMAAGLRVDVATGRIADAQGHMTKAAFSAGPETGGERCRDILGNVATLADAPIFVIRDVATRGLPEHAASLAGTALLGGFGRVVAERLGGAGDEHARELALGISAMVTQALILIGVPESGVARDQDASRAAGTCMWRHGGPAERLPTIRAREPLA